MRYFKLFLFFFFCSSVSVSFAQSETVDTAIEERIRRISAIVVEQVNLQSEPGYYIPALGFGVRFGGETLFNGEIFNPTIPMFGFFIDARFLRFTSGFGVVRLLIEAPLAQSDRNTTVADIALINSRYTISGGFGGGFNFLDTRLRNKGMGSVLTVLFLATIGSRFGTPENMTNPTSLFGGAEVGFTYQYYFHRYASIKVGWDFGLRFGATSTATYNFLIGMAF
ncbi:MAG: hypothetical protein ACRCY4_04160 [Brevinema sp.]